MLINVTLFTNEKNNSIHITYRSGNYRRKLKHEGGMIHNYHILNKNW
jgi:hypothetical protein